MAGVLFDRACKRFGDVSAVKDLTLEIRDGEFMVLVGPSGSGKTTALRLLAGLESLSDGHLTIGDQVVDRKAPADRDIAMVFQDYALYPQMSVFENMAFGLRMRKMPKPEILERVTWAAGVLGLTEYLRRKPGQLSGGQRQRTALGRALVRRPRVFLMDEPLSNLDAALRAQMRAEIRRLQQQVATTTVYVTHDQIEAMTMGDRIAVMKDGELLQVDAPDVLYAEPASLFVATFIGSPAMGTGRWKCDDTAVGLVLRCGGAELAIATPAPRAAGAEVIVGVRPESAALWAPGSGLVGPVDGAVSYIEALGRETFAGVDTEAGKYVIEMAPTVRLGIGERVQIGLAPGALHLFDPDTTQAIGKV
jgi:ABC-type sugar transport system ATPase subunit